MRTNDNFCSAIVISLVSFFRQVDQSQIALDFSCPSERIQDAKIQAVRAIQIIHLAVA